MRSLTARHVAAPRRGAQGRHCPRRQGRARQRGNALVWALLALLLMAVAGVGTLQAQRTQQRRDAGYAEATVLQALRNAVNAAIFEQVVGLQAGNALAKNGVSVAPVMSGGMLVWSPTVPQLAAMGYLPSGWTVTTSALNGAPYAVSFQRTPAGCAPAACAIEGQVVVMGALNDTGTPGQMDGVTVGALLTRIGADAGVSLPTAPGAISGFDNTWSAANPVAGAPPGVLAVRVGTASAGFSQFVRINDSRDPNLAGSLTVAGALNVGGVATLRGAPLHVNAADGTSCVQLQPTGAVRVACSGALEGRTGSFTDGAGNSTLITPGTVTATGGVSAGGNLTATGSVTGNRLRPVGNYAPGAACTEPNAVAGNLAQTGLVLCSSGAWRAIVTQASAGQSCSPEGTTAQANGVALLCRGGSYVAMTSFLRRANTGSACAEAGAMAVDVATGAAVLCRGNPAGGTLLWYRAQDLASNLQWIRSQEVVDGQVVPKPTCGSSAGYSGQAAVMLTPMAEGSSDASFSRYAVDNGSSWTVFLRDSAGNVLQAHSASGSATALAQQYCYYP
jgi:hypothetical protein